MTKKPVYRIFNGVDSEDKIIKVSSFLSTLKGKVIIATVARMTKKKGVQNIVELAPSLLEKYENVIILNDRGRAPQKNLEKTVEEKGYQGTFILQAKSPRGEGSWRIWKKQIFLRFLPLMKLLELLSLKLSLKKFLLLQ